MHDPPRIDPEFKTLIPPLSPEEYGQLEQNILTHGCRDPITLWRGIIIDGHNRFEICTGHGIEYKTIQLRFPSRDAAKVWVLENQLGRRNLTDALRIELAAMKLEYMGQKTYARKNIAREAGLSEQTVQRYMKIKAYGDPELVENVMTGRVKIGTAHRGMGHIEITTTTKEEFEASTPPEEVAHNYARAAVENIGLIRNMYEFLVEHLPYCEDVAAGVPARLGRQKKRVGRLERRAS